MNRKLLEAWKKHRQKVKSDPDRFGNLPRFDLAGELKGAPDHFFSIMTGQMPNSQVALGSRRDRRMVRLRQRLLKQGQPRSPTIGPITRPEKIDRVLSRNIHTVRDALLNTAEKRQKREIVTFGKLLAFKRDNLPGGSARKERRRQQFIDSLEARALNYMRKLGPNYTTPRQIDVFRPSSQN